MNIQALMQQAQTMQKKVEANVENAKKELGNKEVHAEAGSGLVKVTMTGRHVVKRLTIDPSLLEDEPESKVESIDNETDLKPDQFNSRLLTTVKG